MKCRLRPTADEPQNGRQKHLCIRDCRNPIGKQRPKFVPLGNAIRDHGNCTAWPLWNEPHEWLILIGESLLIHRDVWPWLKLHFWFLPPLEIDGAGPGNELAQILHALRAGQMGMECNQWRQKMNDWGADGCREHREEILNRLREQYAKAPRRVRAMCLMHAIARGYPLTLAGLLDLAAERAKRGI